MTRLTTAVHSTPVGDAVIVLADDKLVSLQLAADDLDRVREHVFRALPSLPVEDDSPAESVARQLDEYFAGSRRAFDLEIDWRLTNGFARSALQAVTEIPYGETAGYGEVAIWAGSPRAARAVGTACATTPISVVVPVHRVIRADGNIGQYGGHIEIKRYLLSLESGADE